MLGGVLPPLEACPRLVVPVQADGRGLAVDERIVAGLPRPAPRSRPAPGRAAGPGAAPDPPRGELPGTPRPGRRAGRHRSRGRPAARGRSAPRSSWAAGGAGRSRRPPIGGRARRPARPVAPPARRCATRSPTVPPRGRPIPGSPRVARSHRREPGPPPGRRARPRAGRREPPRPGREARPSARRPTSWRAPTHPTNPGSASIARWNGTVVWIPPISTSATARRSRARAAGRSSAWTMSLAMSGSYSAGTRSPSSTAVSTRIPGPEGIRQRVIRPGAGAKTRAGSSAEMRSSMAWLVGRAARSAAARTRAESGSPAARRNCSWTMSTPATSSVTGCSTWSRVLTSRNQKSPSRS